MMSLFLNPWTFIAGALLVSMPIIIHLINRIRFRRVKWAAMEFLLKAQKRMRRRKILEQLLLLLLRCLLVFLVGVLLARFTGCGQQEGSETRPTTHVIILDDTPSMADGARGEQGDQGNALNEAKRLIIDKLMPATAEATTTQTMHLVRLSNLDEAFPANTKKVRQDGAEKDLPRAPDEVRAAAKVNADSIQEMTNYLQLVQPSTVRRSLLDGLDKAKAILNEAPPSDARVIHVVSDLRAIDWTTDGPAISDKLREYKDAGITVHLIDVGQPARKPDRKSPPFNDNIAIVELKPRNRVVSVNQQTEIEVRVKNFGNTDVPDVDLSFFLNGQGNIITSAKIPSLPAGQEATQTITVTFSPPSAKVGTKENPLDRFNLITAALSKPEPGGLVIDNARHTVVEVRDTVKVLIVDGRTVEAGIDLRTKPEGDSYYLRTLFQTKAQELGNLEVISAEAAQLDRLDLRPYSTIYLMNVPTLSDAAVKNVEKFVSEGGGVGVFLGPNVIANDYTTRFYRGTAGFFPVPLTAESKELTEEEKLKREFAFSKRLLLRSKAREEHPALQRIYLDDRGQRVKNDGVEQFFYFANIDKHWIVSRRGAWRDDKSVQELYSLPNDASIGSFEQRAEELVKAIREKYNEPKFQQARIFVDPLLQKIREVTKQPVPLSLLAGYLDQLIADQINDGHESEPVLREFWAQPEMAEIKQQAMLLRDEAKYGDPLYVVKQFGQGRVAVMTTDAGGTFAGRKLWTDWPSLKGSPSWVVIVGEMQKYLAGGGDETNRTVGTPFEAKFDTNRYEPTVQVHFLTADTTKLSERLLPLTLKEIGKLTMDAPAPAKDAPPDAPPPPYQLNHNNTHAVGAYLFTLTRKKSGPVPSLGGAGKPDPLGDLDFVGVAYNVDAAIEGNLRRESTDELEKHTLKAPIHNTEDLGWIETLKQKPSDLSSRRWLYLVILLVLIAEQAWAVRISYHTRPEDLELLAPSAAAAYAHHATPMPSANAAAVAPGAPAGERVPE